MKQEDFVARYQALKARCFALHGQRELFQLPTLGDVASLPAFCVCGQPHLNGKGPECDVLSDLACGGEEKSWLFKAFHLDEALTKAGV